MSDNRAIGIFDSGLGGLTVAKEIMKLLPNEDIVYFGDTGRVPYGTRSAETIKKYALQDERFLLSKDVKIIVAACGTVSSVAKETGDSLPVPFVEVISHSVRQAVNVTRNKKIGVLATNATIGSHAHKNEILKYGKDFEVTENAATLLVPIVEEGFVAKDDVIALQTVRRYLEPMINVGCDTVILGCTHFPILKGAMQKVMGDNVSFINMGYETAKAVKQMLAQSNSLSDKQSAGERNFYVSDKSSTFAKTASILLGEEFDENNVEQVDINLI